MSNQTFRRHPGHFCWRFSDQLSYRWTGGFYEPSHVEAPPLWVSLPMLMPPLIRPELSQRAGWQSAPFPSAFGAKLQTGSFDKYENSELGLSPCFREVIKSLLLESILLLEIISNLTFRNMLQVGETVILGSVVLSPNFKVTFSWKYIYIFFMHAEWRETTSLINKLWYFEAPDENTAIFFPFQ